MAKKVELPEPIIPNKSWKIVELGDYIKILNGYPFDSDKFTNSSDNKYPLIRIRDVVRGYTETYTNEECPDEYKLKMNDILIGMDGDFNCAKWPNDFGVLNQRVCKISSVSKELDEDFLFYYLPIPLKQINDATPSVTVKHLSSTSLQKLHFPLPTLEEQQRIVNRIETLFAKLDQAKEKAQNVVDTFETRKASILHKAFTGELTKKWREENGVGNDSFGEKSLECVCEVTSSKRIYQENQTDNGIPFLRISDLMKYIETDTISSELYISEEMYTELLQTDNVPQQNDILVTTRGTIGKCYLIKKTDKFYFQDGMISWLKKIKSTINPIYILYLFDSKEIIDQIKETQNGSTVAYLSIGMLRKLKFLCPSLPEQQEIVRILDKILEKENQAKEVAQAVLEQIDLLKKSILARAFRGEL